MPQVGTITLSDIAKYSEISPNIVKYHSAQIAKDFDNYYQIWLRFISLAIEFETLTEKNYAEKNEFNNSFQF